MCSSALLTAQSLLNASTTSRMVSTCLQLRRIALLRSCRCFLSTNPSACRSLSCELPRGLPTFAQPCLRRARHDSSCWQGAVADGTAVEVHCSSLQQQRVRIAAGFATSKVQCRCIRSSTALQAAKRNPADLVKRISRGSDCRSESSTYNCAATAHTGPTVPMRLRLQRMWIFLLRGAAAQAART